MKYLLFLAVFLFPLQLFSNDVDYKKDHAEAKRTGKVWILIVGEDW